MTGFTPLLAHAGEGATWQSLVVVFGLGLAAVVLLAIAGRVTIEGPDDLVLPIAGIAIVSSLAPLGSEWLSDWIGWAFPIGVVALVMVMLAAFTPFELSARSPFPYGGIAIAAIGAVSLHQPITLAWHPPPDFLPIADDVEVTITSPDDGGDVSAGELMVSVRIDGGSVQADLVALERLPADPEEAGHLGVTVDGQSFEAAFAEDCTIEAPCTEVTFPVDVESGERTIAVEFRRGDGAPMTPLVTDRVEFRAS